MARQIIWKSLYSVGNDSLDGQHKQILEIINDLYEALDEGDHHDTMKSLLDRLLQYTNTHFAYEERLMREAGYPNIEEHVALHDSLRRKTAGLRSHTNLVMGQDLLHFLRQWWIGHIQEEDQRYAPYLAGKVASV